MYKTGRSKCDINTPYISDLEPWKELGVLDNHDPFDDGGLYTGETCLHIAIVQSKSEGDTSLVEWMLAKGAHITCRATGSFFKGKVIKMRSSRSGGGASQGASAGGDGQGRARFAPMRAAWCTHACSARRGERFEGVGIACFCLLAIVRSLREKNLSFTR